MARLIALLSILSCAAFSSAFLGSSVGRPETLVLMAGKDVPAMERREWLTLTLAGGAAALLNPAMASAASFTAGGTLVDRDVGVQVGNLEASASRRADNSNVIFDKDHYFKFGVAAPWIEPGSTEFPKSVPFTPSQQRYDALKKYGSRVRNGVQFIGSLEDMVKNNPSGLPDPATTPDYALRPMGLLANSFMASENTGATNELFLARWYINEIYLQLNDARAASSPEQAAKFYALARKATNSYLGLMNRVINAKVGDPLELLS